MQFPKKLLFLGATFGGLVVLTMLFCQLPIFSLAQERANYTNAKLESAKLIHIEQAPVLVISGTAIEIGEQEAELAGKQARELLAYAPALIKQVAGEKGWQHHQAMSVRLVKNSAERHQQELAAFCNKLKLTPEQIEASQTLYDTMNAFGCSSLLIPPEKSATKEILFGRNLDYATFGLLHKYNLVKVYRPQGKFAFVSIGFPGCLGVVSGMNEHGLALALHEVRSANDGSLPFSQEGVPTMLLLRELLEECRTVADAQKMLEKSKRTTSFTLPICDPTTCAVLEVTVNTVGYRTNPGLVVCTNHFRCKELSHGKGCQRYEKLERDAKQPFTVDSVTKKLAEVNQGNATFQSMVFEPKSQAVYVSLLTLPSSNGTFTKIDLQPYWKTNSANP
jgi:isopenicillin-N N-acyltransferase like protein